jgi:hypothetical protein
MDSWLTGPRQGMAGRASPGLGQRQGGLLACQGGLACECDSEIRVLVCFHDVSCACVDSVSEMRVWSCEIGGQASVRVMVCSHAWGSRVQQKVRVVAP